MLQNGKLILGENQYYNMDSYQTKLNNNVFVAGASGSGKTRSIVIPNLLQASGSYIISDPKGNLYRKYKNFFKKQGYAVKSVNFIHPEWSTGYNPLAYVHSEQDILRMAKMLVSIGGPSISNDPFWDQSTELLFSAIVAMVVERQIPEEQNLTSVIALIAACQVSEYSDAETVMDLIMKKHGEKVSNSFAVKQYKKFCVAAKKTMKSILITANAKLGRFDTKEVRKMLEQDFVNLPAIGQKKTAVFVEVSDSDRSMDGLANLFFSQAIQELCRYADDECWRNDYRLPVDVRFILDDFATNVQIEDFPRIISSIRSRGISAMLMVQAEGQLEKYYRGDSKTIISNCDSYVYLGGNDVDTAWSVAQRSDRPLQEVLNMPVGMSWIFRRGQEPVYTRQFDLERERTDLEKGEER